MKSLAWMVVLLGVVFGIGWQTSRLVERKQPDGDARGDGRGFDRGLRFSGTPFGPPQHFLDDLSLDDTQRARIDALVAQSAAQIDQHEASIHDVMERTRADVLAVLTDAQRAQLDSMIDDVFAKRRRERVEADVAWFKKNATVAADGLVRIEAALTEYETAKSALYKPKGATAGGPPARPDKSASDALRAKRDQSLAEIVDAATLERFRSDSSRSRHGPGHDGGPSRGTQDSHQPKE